MMKTTWMACLALIPALLFGEEDSVTTMIRNSNQFAIDLFKDVSSGVQENMCLSPYSAYTALSMLLPGASGNTLTGIQNTMHNTLPVDKTNDVLQSINQKIFSRLSETSSELRLILGNSLWIQSGLTVNPAFIGTMDQYFRGAFRRTDYINQVETSRSEINNWVREKTLGKVSMLFAQGEITPYSRMVLASALYIKARWARPFNNQLTHQEPFFSDDSSTLSVLMMVDGGDYSYLDTTDFKILQIPFVTLRTQNAQLAMAILLPHTRGQLDSIVKTLNSNTLQTWLLGMKSQRVELMIPKFKITYSIVLNAALSRFGMAEAFNDGADFSGIAKDPLKLNIMKQKNYFVLDENGIEAPSSLGGLPRAPTTSDQSPVIFKADHPFAYIIYDTNTGVILYVGKVVNPLI